MLYAEKPLPVARTELVPTEYAMKNQAEMPRRLGIIAGGGALPAKVAAAARAAGRAVFIVGLEGFADPAVLAPWPHEMRRLGAAARIIAALREHGCQDLVMIGPVRRPSLLDLRPGRRGRQAAGPHRTRRLCRRRRLARGGHPGADRGRVSASSARTRSCARRSPRPAC